MRQRARGTRDRLPGRPSAGARRSGRHTPPARLPGRLPSLTGLRAFGALLVFIGHADVIAGFSPFTRGDRLLGPALSMISLFFVLSGFVLAWSYASHLSAIPFLRRRAARLVPLYLAALAVATVVDLRLHTGLTVSHGLPSALLLQSWFPHPGVAFAVNGPGWSLSDEFFFYLLFPLLLPLLRRVPARLRLPLVGLLALIEVADAFVTSHVAGYAGLYWNYVFPPLRLCEFAAGVIMCLLVRDGWRPPLGVRGAGVLFLLVYGAGIFAGERWQAAAITFVPICLLVPALAVDDVSGRPGRLLARPLLVRLGDWSFAFYLLHQVVLEVLSRADHGHAAHSPFRGLALTALALMISLVGAKVLHERLEVPLELRLGGARRVAHGAAETVSVIDVPASREATSVELDGIRPAG